VVLSDGGDADRAGRDEDGGLGDEGHGEQRGEILMSRLILVIWPRCALFG